MKSRSFLLRLLTLTAMLVPLAAFGQVQVLRISVTPNEGPGGQFIPTATVTLTAAAPAGGVTCSLSSDNDAVSMPATLAIAAGATSGTVPVTTSVVTSSTVADLTASLNGGSASAVLTVDPAVKVTALVFNPSPVHGLQTTTGTVTLSGVAPASGLTCSLSSDNSAAIVPASAFIKTGETSATFKVSTAFVATNTVANITASLVNGGSVKTPLTITIPIAVKSLTLSPTTVFGNQQRANGKITLYAKAEGSGCICRITCDGEEAQPPTFVKVPSGSIAAVFTIPTKFVKASTTVNIAATAGGTSRTQSLTILPPIVPSRLTLSPSSATAGTMITATLDLSAPVFKGGMDVQIASSNKAAIVPPSVNFDQGESEVRFPITTKEVLANTTLAIIAQCGGVSVKAPLTLSPSGSIQSVKLYSDTVIGGHGASGVITLARPAGSNGAVCTLSLSDTTFAGLPQSTVLIPARARTGTFRVSSTPPSTSTSTTVKVSTLSNSVSVDLTILPWAISSSPWPREGGGVLNSGQASYRSVSSSGISEAAPIQLGDADATGLALGDDAFQGVSTVYTGSSNAFYASKNGAITHQLNMTMSGGTPAVGADGTIYVGQYSSPYRLLALNPDFTIKWQYPASDMGAGPITTCPNIGPDGSIYYCNGPKTSNPDGKGALTKLSSDGSFQWTIPVDHILHNSPVIGPDGTVYVLDFNGILYSIRPDGLGDDGTRFNWILNLGGKNFYAPTVGPDGTIYVCTDGIGLCAIAPDGGILWLQNIYAKLRGGRVSVGIDGAIYVPGADGLYAFNSDGFLRWKYASTTGITDPPSISADGKVYFWSDGAIRALNPDMSMFWSWPISNQCSRAPALGVNGAVYIRESNGLLHTFYRIG